MNSSKSPALSFFIYLIHVLEPSVRAELMEQVPHIAMYCHQYPEHLHQAVPLHLLPLVVTFLTDTNNQVTLSDNTHPTIVGLQVRKTSQAALLVLLEQGLVDAEDVEDQVGTFYQVQREKELSMQQH